MCMYGTSKLGYDPILTDCHVMTTMYIIYTKEFTHMYAQYIHPSYAVGDLG